MNKNLLLIVILFITTAGFAQKAYVKNIDFSSKAKKISRNVESNHIWSDDFSNPNTWIIDHDKSQTSLDWEIGTDLSCGGVHPIETIASSSYENGYAMIDSDEYGGESGGAEVEDSWFTTADSINLSDYPNVVVQFETWYQSFTSEKCFLVTSTNNTDWPELSPSFDASTNPNVYEVFPEISGDARENVGANPTTYKINISESAGNEEQVWIRFHWTGTYGYAWFIDDVAVIEQPKNDIILHSAWMTNGSIVEYGRIPSSQLNDTLILGGVVSNFGTDPQENVTLNVSVKNASNNELLSEQATLPLLKNDSIALFTLVAPSNLNAGAYTLEAAASSDLDNDSLPAQFANNSYTRNFEITEELYAVDGVGVYDDDKVSLSSMGTKSFIEDRDGLIMMVYYRILQNTQVSGIEIAITPETEVGAYVYPFILDGEARLNVNVYEDRISENMDGIRVEQWHIDAGKVWLPLPQTNLEPGVYYACVELFSEYGTNHISIYDDKTVIQPDGVSNIYSPTDEQIFTNGNAFAIRLGLGNYVNIREKSSEILSLYPNPSSGFITIDSEINIKNIEIVNLLGEVVLTKTVNNLSNQSFDLSDYDAGIYFFRIATDETEFTKRFLLK